MLKRLLQQQKYFKRIYKEQKGITGLETAIILIAFVVVASVFAYTVLSAGLFSTQKSQEAVYSGLQESRSSVEVKGSVVATSVALLDSMDYPLGWVGDTDATLTRETTTKWEGSASLKVDIAAGMSLNDTIIYHAMKAVDLTNGDTLSFWVKADAALDSKMTFAVGTTTDLQGSATQTTLINTSAGTGWQKYTMTFAGGNDDTAVYYGVYLSTDAIGTFYIDNVQFDSVASNFGSPLPLDNCDYLAWSPDTDATITREATDYVEGTGSTKVIIADGMAQNDTIISRVMNAKSFANGDTITFWAKLPGALDSNITFAIATGANLQGTATETYVVNPAGTGWEKHTVTLTGGDDTASTYFGFYLSTDAVGTFYIDDIEVSAKFNNNDDPMPTFASSLKFTLGIPTDGEGVDFITTTDSDADGILSDESTKTHKVIVYYMDNFQQVTDVSWTQTFIGKNDSDNILETSEKLQMTVDLTYINNNAGQFPSKKVGPNHQFTVEVKPPNGATLSLERTMPAKINAVENLN